VNDEPLREIKRGEHRVPRWISMLWLAFVACLALTAIVMAVRLGGDLVDILIVLAVSFYVIFALSAIAYFALYGLSVLLEGRDYHKIHCDDSKHWAGMMDFMR
jgi:hypothetical protein